MRMAVVMGLLFGGMLARAAAVEGTPIAISEYQQRRAAIQKGLKGPLVLFGNVAASEEQLRSGFLQDSFFHYFTGWDQPDAMVILTAQEAELFLPPRDGVYERYYGHRTSASDADASRLTGFSKVQPATEFEREFFRLLGSGDSAFVLPSEAGSGAVKSLLALRPAVKVQDYSKEAIALRRVKSTAERAAIRHSAEVSIEAQLRAMQVIAPGRKEYEVAAEMAAVWSKAGCERAAYTPIVASGPNAMTLHYAANKRQMDGGEVVVLDAAAECASYAADITRTLPVSGRFTARQAELYRVVLEAQEAAIAAIHPGAVIGKKDTPGSVMKIAYDYINTHGKDLHGEALGKYVVHGLSHDIGLDVHDPGDIMAPLAAGMVISVEPGLYIREENIGIRIEDMVAVTAEGHEVMTARLPKDQATLERLMQKGRLSSGRPSSVQSAGAAARPENGRN